MYYSNNNVESKKTAGFEIINSFMEFSQDRRASPETSPRLNKLKKSESFESAKTVTINNHNLVQAEFYLKEINHHSNSILSFKILNEDLINVSQEKFSFLINCLKAMLGTTEYKLIERKLFNHYSNYKFRLIVDEINAIINIIQQMNDEMKDFMNSDYSYFKTSIQTIFESIEQWIKSNLIIEPDKFE